MPMGFAADSDPVADESAAPPSRMGMGLIGWSPMCAPIRRRRCCGVLLPRRCAAFGLSSADRCRGDR
jgi:hypothetical protein